MTNQIKILLATDFSPTTKEVIELISHIQEKVPCDTTFIHVVPSRWKEWLSSGLYKKAALQRLETWQQKICKTIDTKKLHVEYGNAADTIIQLAQEIKADFVFIGAKGLDKQGRYKTGTTVESVVRYAKQSVWVCKTSSISKILCGIDGSKNSDNALREAIKLCNLFSAKLRLAFVLSTIDLSPLGMEEEEIEEQEEQYRQQKIKEMQKFLEQFDFKGIHVEQHFLWGTPANIILDMAEDFNQDLIIVGAKGHSLLHHVLIGSTTEKILRHAPCSLLVVR